MKRFAPLIYLLVALVAFSCNLANKSGNGLHEDPQMAITERNDNFLALGPGTPLPNPSELLMIESGVCTYLDKTVTPPDTFTVPVCGGVGDFFLQLPRVSSSGGANIDNIFIVNWVPLDENDPGIAYAETYLCEELKIEEVRPGKICVSDMAGGRMQCVELSVCDKITFFVKGASVKMYVPKGRCPVTPY